MDPAGLDVRPSYTPASSYPSTPSNTPATPAATEPARTRPVQDRFESPSTTPERRAQGDTFTPASTGPTATRPETQPATKGNPWDFRGGPDSEVGKTIQGMVDRARTSTSRIAGQTPESILTKSFFANPAITNDQIMAMSRLKDDPGKVFSTEKTREATEKAIPDARNHPNHKFTVDLFHAMTGIPRADLSRTSPDLGMVGSATIPVPGSNMPTLGMVPNPAYKPGGQPFLWKPRNDSESLSTALHDFTDGMKAASDKGAKGLDGIQKSIWGSEGKVSSAWRSFVDGVPEKFLDTRTLNEGDSSVQRRIRGQQLQRDGLWTGAP